MSSITPPEWLQLLRERPLKETRDIFISFTNNLLNSLLGGIAVLLDGVETGKYDKQATKEWLIYIQRNAQTLFEIVRTVTDREWGEGEQ